MEVNSTNLLQKTPKPQNPGRYDYECLQKYNLLNKYQMADPKKENVNIYRKLKRFVRSKIRWNDRQLQTQLMINLCSIFIIFFLLYSIVVFFCTKYVYLEYFKETVDADLDPILEDRLDYST